MQQGIEQGGGQLGADRQIPPVVEGKGAALDRILLGHQQRLAGKAAHQLVPIEGVVIAVGHPLIQLVTEPLEGGEETGG